MNDGTERGLLSVGVLLVIIIVSALLYAPLNIIDWTLVLPMILTLFGLWIIVLAGMRSSSPQKYERGPFSTLSWGLLLVAIGGAWFLYGYGYGWPYALIVVLLVLAILAIVVAVKRK